MAFVGAGCMGMISLAVWPEVIPGIAVAAGGALGYAGGRLIRDR